MMPLRKRVWMLLGLDDLLSFRGALPPGWGGHSQTPALGPGSGHLSDGHQYPLLCPVWKACLTSSPAPALPDSSPRLANLTSLLHPESEHDPASRGSPRPGPPLLAVPCGQHPLRTRLQSSQAIVLPWPRWLYQSVDALSPRSAPRPPVTAPAPGYCCESLVCISSSKPTASPQEG